MLAVPVNHAAQLAVDLLHERTALIRVQLPQLQCAILSQRGVCRRLPSGGGRYKLRQQPTHGVAEEAGLLASILQLYLVVAFALAPCGAEARKDERHCDHVFFIDGVANRALIAEQLNYKHGHVHISIFYMPAFLVPLIDNPAG